MGCGVELAAVGDNEQVLMTAADDNRGLLIGCGDETAAVGDNEPWSVVAGADDFSGLSQLNCAQKPIVNTLIFTSTCFCKTNM